ncbi:YdeI/OmpD-associated family protein [Paenibacillus eucommiae]|uniref:Bifunctional DNA-binding transcriptional regulator/antitoxin component of YhaV-PrlF toxin-antitoxin module n=1 Tax=Paenibacillus eucommiae TaxID=1355755 RepID=A0ABS4ITU6_9BACL|nr:YdeI/OmpD-associated family protein [Paenibacillus eucommiae]MBP1990999.1 bifunctional DNA-binding transcriptional regulator/antitoxin component of YhaV-PrlF toxin-antitoxin module [Paenibacillus eucommiae]
MKVYSFEAEILKHDDMDAAYITFPYDVQKEFGAKGQVKIKAIFDGEVEYRGSLAKMGLDHHCLGITKKVREQLGKRPGDRIQVRLNKDEEARIVEIPADLQEELQAHKLEQAFLKLSYTKQKEMVESIGHAKKAETRLRRISNFINNLRRDEK